MSDINRLSHKYVSNPFLSKLMGVPGKAHRYGRPQTAQQNRSNTANNAVHSQGAKINQSASRVSNLLRAKTLRSLHEPNAGQPDNRVHGAALPASKVQMNVSENIPIEGRHAAQNGITEAGAQARTNAEKLDVNRGSDEISPPMMIINNKYNTQKVQGRVTSGGQRPVLPDQGTPPEAGQSRPEL